MKRNKTVAYLLAASLLVGGTFVGTKALFQSTAESQNQLILKTGKVDISIKEPSTWKRNLVDANKNGVIDTADLTVPANQKVEVSKSFTNVQPGDTFTKYINILNANSTYDIKLDIQKNLNGIPEELRDYIVIEDGKEADKQHPGVSASQFENLTTIPAGQNTGGFVTIKILDTKGAWEAINKLQNNNIDLNAVFTVTATQAK